MEMESLPEQTSHFVGAKVSRVSFFNSTDRFVTASYGEVSSNSVSLWRVVDSHGLDAADAFAPPFQNITSAQLAGDVTDIVVLKDDKLLACTSHGSINLLQYRPGESENCPSLQLTNNWRTVHDSPCSSLSVACTSLVGGDESGRLVCIDLKSGKLLQRKAAEHSSAIHCLQHYETNKVVAGNSASQLQLFDTRDSSCVPTLTAVVGDGTTAVTTLHVHPSQQHLIAVGTACGSIGFVDLRNPSTGAAFNSTLLPPTFDGPVWQIKFHPSFPDNCFTCSDDGSLLMWNAAALRQHATGVQINPWLFGEELADRLEVTELLPSTSLPINSIDVIDDTLLAGSDNHSATLIRHFNFV